MWRYRLLLLVMLGSLWTAAPGSGGDPDPTPADEQVLTAAHLPVTDAGLLDIFRKRTVSDAERARMKRLIAQLGDDAFEVREKASAQLLAYGPVVEPLLEQACKDRDIEVVRRAEECLRQIRRGSSQVLVIAAAHLLARRKPAGAAEVLLAYLPFADNDLVVEAVQEALTALAVRDGKPHPALAAAVADPSALRRGVAAVALLRAGPPGQRASFRKFLRDPAPEVRLQVGLALAAAKDKEAIPALIDLLAVIPEERSWRVEDVLLRLAGDSAPAAVLDSSEASRRKCRDAWSEWWKQHGPKADLAALEKPPQALGYTLVVLLDAGRVMELDAQNKPRWKIDGLQLPLDVQLLPGNRVLVAEHNANRITERTLKGEVVWAKDMDAEYGQPLMAQRLRNGNTFIATRSHLLEVDRAGKVVFARAEEGGDEIRKAAKLRNGDIACVLGSLRFVLRDAAGKELRSFPVQVQTYGGRIDVLPNGHVLVPEHGHNKVVEYNAEGKAVWEVAIEQPIAAVALPNGNVLATSMSQFRAVEFDRTGKEVWQFKADTKVTRAFRR
jgi:HEAT repeat protein